MKSIFRKSLLIALSVLLVFGLGYGAAWTFDKSQSGNYSAYGDPVYQGTTFANTGVPVVSGRTIGTDSDLTFSGDTLTATALDAPTGRAASYVIAASDATAAEKAQADLQVDDVSDSQVQTAITAATGGKVVFRGTFTKSAATALLIPSNTEIEIQGTITLANNLNVDCAIFQNANKWTGNTNISIYGGTINLNSANQTAGRQVACVFHNCSKITIDSYFVNFQGKSPYQLYDCSLCNVKPDYTVSNPVMTNDFISTITRTTAGASLSLTAGDTWGSVWKEDATHYYLFCSAGTSAIYRYFSSDGISWGSRISVMSPGGGATWDADSIWCPNVWKESSTYYMLYAGMATGSHAKMGLATSSDMTTWTKYVSNPVYDNTDTTWGLGAEPNGVIKVGSVYNVWINNYGGTGSGHNRMTGRITSTDLITWTADVNNPIFMERRFCPFVFTAGSPVYYYMIITHQNTTDSDYAYFELYRDSNPTFYASEREYLGVFRFTSRSSATYDGGDLDVPYIAIGNINQNLGVFSSVKKLYFSSQTQAGVWNMGYDTFAASALDSGVNVYDTYSSTASASGATLASGSVKSGKNCLKIPTSASAEAIRFPTKGDKGERVFWYKQDGSTATVYIRLQMDDDTAVGYIRIDSLALAYTDNAVYTGTQNNLVVNGWYQIKLKWDSNTGLWGFDVKDTNYNTILSKDNLRLNPVSSIDFIKITRNANPTANLYIDMMGSESFAKVNDIGYIAPGEIRTASGLLIAGVTNAIGFAWHNSELQDCYIQRVVVSVNSAAAAAATGQVGIADDNAGTNLGSEFFTAITLDSLGVYDSYVAADTGAQTKYVLIQDSASVTDGWINLKILVNDSTATGTYYIEYVGK